MVVKGRTVGRSLTVTTSGAVCGVVRGREGGREGVTHASGLL